jgi:hypothetical protein
MWKRIVGFPAGFLRQRHRACRNCQTVELSGSHPPRSIRLGRLSVPWKTRQARQIQANTNRRNRRVNDTLSCALANPLGREALACATNSSTLISSPIIRHGSRETCLQVPEVLEEWFASKVLHAMACYSRSTVGDNTTQPRIFQRRVNWMWRSVLIRRSQRAQVRWERLTPLLNRWVPQPRVLHPYPEARFYATHPS